MSGHRSTSLLSAPATPAADDPATSDRLRVIPELRNHHVALLAEMPAARTFYFARKYDLADTELPAGLEQISFGRLLRVVASSRATTLELWEPLWVRLLSRHVTLGLLWHFGRPRRGRRLVSAAMENNDLGHLIGGHRPAPGGITAVFGLALGAYLRLVYTRLVFATDGARRAYHGIPGVRHIPHRVIDHLPRRPAEPVVDATLPGTVVFLARLEVRKGIRELMDAWPQVAAGRPGARLLVVGDGPESEAVRRWCADDGASRRYLGGLPHQEALEILDEAEVLVLPSIRDGRWREQVGLPLHEGLRAGVTIVATDESGLAPWLAERGHRVVAADRVDTELAAALLDALARPLPAAEVVATLPDLDGRVAQSRWLHHG